VRFSLGLITEPYLPVKRHAELTRESRWHVAGYAIMAIVSLMERSWMAVVLWIAPMVTMKFVHQLQNTIEHLGLTHHAFPGVPFHRLRELHDALFTHRGRAPPSMTYWGFQRAVLRALAHGRSEADYPEDRTWIADLAHE
jgi:fatty acid desaturase